ncbi:MAG: hypothetical protein O3B45_06280 [Bacteroidetes bacterium]|nr:hypothetical protein [Bacteroidota bacterium]
MNQGTWRRQWARVTGVLMISLATAVGSFGQMAVERATALGQGGNWEDALDVLLPEINSGGLQTDAHAWYVLGYIQKELYKKTEANDVDSPRRLSAVSSLQRAAELSPSVVDHDLIISALDFLSRSYLRDAIGRVEGFTAGSDEEILSLFGRYEAIEMSMNPKADVNVQKADVYRYLGQANGLLLAGLKGTNLELEQQLFDRSVGHYESALKLKPGEYSGLFNLAITWYNQGVRQLKRIDHETSMFELMEIQDACVELFERSLAPMEAAHKLQPDRFETLKGLMTIHYALNQPEASDRYRKMIEALNENRR